MKNGFTLLETIIYIGLTSLILSSLVLFSYQIISEASSINYSFMAIDDGDFIEHKIEWILNGSVTIDRPAIDQSSNDLEGKGPDGSPISLKLSDENILLDEGRGAAQLAGGPSTISDLLIENILSTSTGHYLKINFKVNDYSFELVKYLP